MPKYEVLLELDHNLERFEPGDVVAMTVAEAEALMAQPEPAIGYLEGDAPKKVEEPVVETAPPDEETPETESEPEEKVTIPEKASRKALEEIAIKAGVESPDKFPNKTALRKAIEERLAETG